MIKVLLILTLMNSGGYAGQGGVTMHEFSTIYDNMAICQEVGKGWKNDVTRKRRGLSDNEIIWTCVPIRRKP